MSLVFSPKGDIACSPGLRRASRRYPGYPAFQFNPKGVADILLLSFKRLRLNTRRTASKKGEHVGKAVALITGASRGIGKGIALELASHGYDIAGVATSLTSGIEDTKREVEARGQRCLTVVADVGKLESHAQITDEVMAAFGRIDVLVNNAGVAPKVRLDILDTTDESFDRLVDINLRGPFFLTQRVAAQMIRQTEAGARYAPKIVFITSISSNVASTNRAEYCISKAGLSMAAQTYAVRLAEYGINVYEIRPA